jgi:UPF0755 protein
VTGAKGASLEPGGGEPAAEGAAASPAPAAGESPPAEHAPTPPRRPRGRWRAAVRWALGLGLLLVVGAATLAAWGWWDLRQPHAGFTGERRVEVASGASGRAILAQLEAAGVIRDARLARVWLLTQGDPPLQAGEYLFRAPLTTPQVLGKVIRGDVAAHRVTLVEGLTLEETAAHLASQGFGDLEALLAAMRDPAPIADFDAAAPDLEGYLFPDSYSFPRGAGERQVVLALVRNFRKRWREKVEPVLPKDGGRTPRELVTLASIVEKEARLAEERPLIAAVYSNRLEQGMGLYADPTVIYALKKAGRWDGNIRREDLALESPYNTYRNAGLPPGPIASPGLGSILAAAAPADVPYLYFVARNDGSHVFATTLQEHNRNVHQWQRLYWRERRRAEGSGR